MIGKLLGRAVLLLTCVAVLNGCASMSTEEKGTLGGAGAGGLIGGIIGHQSGHTAEGALIGAAAGAIGGYIVGHKVQKDQEATDQHSRAVQLFNQANMSSDHKNAIALYNQAIQLEPNQPEFYNNRGLAYLSLGNRDQARADFAKALSINPSYQAAQDNMRRLQYTENQR